MINHKPISCSSLNNLDSLVKVGQKEVGKKILFGDENECHRLASVDCTGVEFGIQAFQEYNKFTISFFPCLPPQPHLTEHDIKK